VEAEISHYSFRFVFFGTKWNPVSAAHGAGTNTPGHPGRAFGPQSSVSIFVSVRFFLERILLVSLDELSVAGPRSSVSIQCAASPKRDYSPFTIHELTERMGIDEH
jgi:hypothetical protein